MTALRLFMVSFLCAAAAVCAACSAKSRSAAEPYRYPDPVTVDRSRGAALSLVTGVTYHADAVNGDDAGDGSAESPWKSLSAAKGKLSGGDCLMLGSGTYSQFDDVSAHDAPVLIINEEGESPVIENVRLRLGADEGKPPLNLVFYGITILPAYVDPASSGAEGCTDPQYTQSTESTYAKSLRPVDLYNVSSVSFIACTIRSLNRYLAQDAVYAVGCPDITVQSCEIREADSGVAFGSSPRMKVLYNYIHDTHSSTIKGSGGSSDVVIEGNHCLGINWSLSDNYAPRAEGKTYHGSLIAVRDSTITIRGNICHDGGNSSGVMLYDSVTPYEHVLIEGNLFFDPHNDSLLRIYDAGTDIVVRNNTVIGRGRYGAANEWRYNTAFAIHRLSGDYGGTRIKVYNNIFAGMVSSNAGFGQTDFRGNVSLAASDWSSGAMDLLEPGALPGNVFADASYALFESGFFAGPFDASWQGWDSDEENLNAPGHGKFLDLSPADGSPALDAGDASLQPVFSLGTLGADGFIRNDGTARGASHHSAGCYEREQR